MARRPPDRDDGGFSEAELDRLRADLAGARRAQRRDRVLLVVASVLVVLCLLLVFFGWRFLPGEAVGPVIGTVLVIGLVAALSLKMLSSWVRTDALVVAARVQLVAAAESLTGFVDERAERLAEEERGEASE